jgi:hypothetical protein
MKLQSGGVVYFCFGAYTASAAEFRGMIRAVLGLQKLNSLPLQVHLIPDERELL